MCALRRVINIAYHQSQPARALLCGSYPTWAHGHGLEGARSCTSWTRSSTVDILKPMTSFLNQNSGFHASCNLNALFPKEPKNWPKYNDIVYPPTPEGEPIRPAEVVHHWSNVKYSSKKLWYLCLMIRGMSIDEAIKQLSFAQRKGGAILKEMLLEAQTMAVQDHNVEFKSNLWITDCRSSRAKIIKGLRKHARGRYSVLNYRYSHIFLRLREGTPPERYYEYPHPANYWAPQESYKSGHQQIQEYIEKARNRVIRKNL